MEELKKSMYYGAKPETLAAAKMLRENMTTCEKLLWERLNLKQVCGLRFRRQHPIDFFISDFYCHEARLVIEIDGDIHNEQREYDDGRSAEMEKYSIKVIRFSNPEVENNLDDVVKRIENEVKKRIQSPPWGPDNYRDRGEFLEELESSYNKSYRSIEIRIEFKN